MSDAVVKLGWDNSGARSGADEALRIAQSLKAKTDKTLARVGNPPGGMQKGGMGMLAMQTQDIAVQAQMGTNALQIFAQQGSQIASIFGEQGAIVGGIAAVAGALVYAGQKGNEAFTALVASSQTLTGELGKVVAAGSISQMTELFGELEKQQAALRAESEGLGTSLMSLAKGVMGTFTGGPALDERRAQMEAAQAGMEQTRAAVLRQIVDLSERETAIAIARVSGNSALADELQRQLSLEQKIFSIRQSQAPVEVQDKLIAQAIALSKAEETAAAAAKNAEDARKRQTARQGLNEARAAVEQFDETDEQRLNRLIREREGLQAAVVSARGDEVAQMEAARALQQQELAILETKRKIANETADAMKKQADLAEAAFNAEARNQESEKEREAKEYKRGIVARADAEKELQILRLKVEGKMEAAAAAEKELQIQQEARRIAEEQNVSYKTALDLARQKVALEDQIAKKQEASTGRIKGYSRAEQGGAAEASARAAKGMLEARQRVEKSRESFSGLREFYRNNERDGNGRRVLPLGRAFEGASRGNDAAVGLLARMVEVMESVNQNTGQLVAV